MAKTSRKFPDHLDIAGIRYKVSYIKQPLISEYDGESELSGFIDYDKQRIHIKKDLSPDLRRSVLFHELLHGVFEAQKIEIKGDRDETRFTPLVRCIYDTLQRNRLLAG